MNERMKRKEKNGSQKIIRYPRLDTVLMVEYYIKKHSAEFKMYQLWKKLPRKVMYQTYKTILAYLLEINKIAIDNERKVVYIWNPEIAKKFLIKKGLEWR